jgi:phage terminase large subunit GpA-like protein
LNSTEAFDGAEAVRQAWKAGLAPDPALTVSEWADRHRILSSRGASEAGPYRTARTPYIRPIMDALSPRHPASRVVFMIAAQVGATKAGNNWMGFCIHRATGPALSASSSAMTKRKRLGSLSCRTHRATKSSSSNPG